MIGGTGRGLLAITMVGLLGACAGPESSEAEPAGADPVVQGEAAAVSGPASAMACAPMSDRMALEGRTSPYDSAQVRIGEATALVCYGRPSARGRTMIGGDAVPYGSLWRTGANEPTTLHLPVAAEVAGVALQPGSYSLYTVPGENEWEVILNRSVDQWGHESAYTEEVRAQEVGRGTVPAASTEQHVETLTLRGEQGALVLEWEDTRVRIPVRPL